MCYPLECDAPNGKLADSSKMASTTSEGAVLGHAIVEQDHSMMSITMRRATGIIPEI